MLLQFFKNYKVLVQDPEKDVNKYSKYSVDIENQLWTMVPNAVICNVYALTGNSPSGFSRQVDI